jgi:poly [ADP-ribose] polymerase
MPPKRAATATAAPIRRSARTATAASTAASAFNSGFVGKKRAHSPDHNGGDAGVNDEDDEPSKSPPKKRAKTTKTSKTKPADDNDDAEEPEDDNATAKTTVKRATSASARKSLAKGVKPKSNGDAADEDKDKDKKNDVDDDDMEDDAKDTPKANSPSPPAKMVTVIKRGAAPVDPGSPHVDTHLVYATNGEIWDAMLNQVCNGLPQFACPSIS